MVGHPTILTMKKTKRFRKAEPIATRQPAGPGIPARKYDTKLDSKKRVVLRGAQHTFYSVNEKPNGTILLTPKMLVDVEPISEHTLEMIDRSMKNLDKGAVFGPVDLTEFSTPRLHRIKRAA